ncbi:MAG: alpha/beta hydrolase [Rhodospirillales bacterium]|nr:alpha/beta hydrolase [Rhodospirillales bacterium]
MNTADPTAQIAELENQAERIETDFGGSSLCWHKWSSPHAERPPIVLLHGGFGSWTHWFRVIPALRAEAPVICADLPGLGASDDVALPHTPEKLADILVQGLDQLLDERQPFHLVGFSFGGLLGSLVAATFTEQCLNFIAVGASGFGSLHHIVDGIELPGADMSDREIEAVHRKNLGLLMFAEAETIDALSLHIQRHNVSRGRVRSRRLSMSDGLLQALPDIKAKIGGIWGELDSTGGGREAIKKRAEIFRRHQPGAAFDIIKGAGHWVMYERPQAFVDTLLRQLQKSEPED